VGFGFQVIEKDVVHQAAHGRLNFVPLGVAVIAVTHADQPHIPKQQLALRQDQLGLVSRQAAEVIDE